MSAIANAKEVFRVISDVARALPVIVAKLPENDDPACLAMVLEETVACLLYTSPSPRD